MSGRRDGFILRAVLHGVLYVVAHPLVTLAVAGAVLAACVAIAWVRLDISTNQNKLFSSKVNFFRNYLSFVEKFPEHEAIYIIIEAAKCWQAASERSTS